MGEIVFGRPKRVRLVGERQRLVPQPQLVVGKCQFGIGVVECTIKDCVWCQDRLGAKHENVERARAQYWDVPCSTKHNGVMATLGILLLQQRSRQISDGTSYTTPTTLRLPRRMHSKLDDKVRRISPHSYCCYDAQRANDERRSNNNRRLVKLSDKARRLGAKYGHKLMYVQGKEEVRNDVIYFGDKRAAFYWKQRILSEGWDCMISFYEASDIVWPAKGFCLTQLQHILTLVPPHRIARKSGTFSVSTFQHVLLAFSHSKPLKLHYMFHIKLVYRWHTGN